MKMIKIIGATLAIVGAIMGFLSILIPAIIIILDGSFPLNKAVACFVVSLCILMLGIFIVSINDED